MNELLNCSVLLPGILNPRVLRIPCLAMVLSELQHLKLKMVGWIFLRVLSAGVREFPGSMAGMWPSTILWRVASHCFLHLSCSGGCFSSRSMHPMHPISLDLYSLLVTWAAWHCTHSSRSTSCLTYGSNTVVPYSSKDLIQGMYAK